jgi:murein DD-endopeptidase MepM/ murein hydrolase activator NlpD
MRIPAAVSALIAATAIPGSVASADHAAGGLEAPGRPAVSAVECSSDDRPACPRGAELTITGESLHSVRSVRFLGFPGRSDDRSATPVARGAHQLVVTVPRFSRSGPLELRGLTARVRTGPVTIGPASADPETAGWRFPVAGAADLGTRVNRFGGGRGHQGQDILAACGEDVVAARSGRVVRNAVHARAGNYLVLEHPDGRSTAYMHLRERSAFNSGDRVSSGDRLGAVGRTGRASACNLHFELWSAPGWYRGGSPLDPATLLRGARR